MSTILGTPPHLTHLDQDGQHVDPRRTWGDRWLVSRLFRWHRPRTRELRLFPPEDVPELQHQWRRRPSLTRKDVQIGTLRTAGTDHRCFADSQRLPVNLRTRHKVVIPVPVDPFLADNGTREWTGYGTPENRDSAIERWSFLTSSAPNIPRRIKARAHSCLAAAWFDQATEDPERWNIDSLHRAGSNANEAVSLGLTGSGGLKVGFSIESQGFRRPEDNRFPGLNTDRFERLTELWEAIDTHTADVERASAKGDGKVSKAPLKYVCSAEDCGIQATKKMGLLRCAGKCPVVFKPSYCSKECQKMVCFFFSGSHSTDSVLSASQDWKRHKPFCKAEATKSSVPSLNANNDTTEDTVQRATPSKDVNSDKSEGRATGHSIDGSARHGGAARVNSKTPGTRTMGELRKVAASGGDSR